jgi:hypothetical protein
MENRSNEFYVASLKKDTELYLSDIYTKEDLENLQIKPSQNCLERNILYEKEYFLNNKFFFKKNMEYKGEDCNCFETENFLSFYIIHVPLVLTYDCL